MVTPALHNFVECQGATLPDLDQRRPARSGAAPKPCEKNRVLKSVSGMPRHWHLVCAVATRSANVVKPSSAMKLFNATPSSFDAINFAVSLSRPGIRIPAQPYTVRLSAGPKVGFPPSRLHMCKTKGEAKLSLRCAFRSHQKMSCTRHPTCVGLPQSVRCTQLALPAPCHN